MNWADESVYCASSSSKLEIALISKTIDLSFIKPVAYLWRFVGDCGRIEQPQPEKSDKTNKCFVQLRQFGWQSLLIKGF